MIDDTDDPELVRLQAVLDRIEALCARRWNQGGQVEAELETLDAEAAMLIRARTDRTLVPLSARLDAAIAEAHRLLGMHVSEPR